MPAIPSGTLACPPTDAGPRLAAKLADMVPGAAAVIVGFTDPATQWPHAYARATDAVGRPVRLSPVARRVVARWVLRAHPAADWTRPHILDLTTGQLTAANHAPVRGR
ncbi:transcriptional regulator [Streptomyces sp. BE20]|uniref:transcriptional regulator n=1 Tax=Streptomyces sp. BE20 TaxID=3002525 RepID=UPI002E79E7D8|nr:transcriptional regulator [Streptomyces sp. BE20]MEE1825346.1 transcriptional regulator [Streptomyces sp. BE20]